MLYIFNVSVHSKPPVTMGQKNERRMTMKVVNPVGRKVSTNVEANYDAQPRACMCNNGFTFSSGMGYNDSKRQIIMRSDAKLPQPFASWSNSL